MERKFGVEMEAFGADKHEVMRRMREAGLTVHNRESNYGYSAVLGGWQMTYDGSIEGRNGFELVSPPLKGEEGREEIRKASAALIAAGAEVNRSCGMHVHIDASDLDLEGYKRVLALAVIFERSMDALVAKSRRGKGARYAQSNRRTIGGDRARALEAIASIGSFSHLRNLLRGDRRHKVNFEAIVERGTVEFRQHNGTVDAEKIVPWLMLCMSLVSSAARSKKVGGAWVSTASFKKMLERVPKQYHAALLARRAALKARNGQDINADGEIRGDGGAR